MERCELSTKPEVNGAKFVATTIGGRKGFDGDGEAGQAGGGA